MNWVAAMRKVGDTLLRWLGLNKQSDYVREYFYATNMRASIYMSVVVIVLELWMIERMTMTIITKHLQSQFWDLTEKYYANYFLLLASGIFTTRPSLRRSRTSTLRTSTPTSARYPWRTS